MGSYNRFYKADLHYRMDALFADCYEVKGESLSTAECLFFRAAACGASIQEAAQVLKWQLNTAQSFVSKTVKVYTKGLIALKQAGQRLQSQKKLPWHQLSYIFKELGYERSHHIDEQGLFEAVSSPSCCVDVSRLIWEINGAIYRVKFDQWEPMLPDDFRQLTEAKIRELGLQANQTKEMQVKREAYIEAIKLSRLLVIEDPLANIDHVVKIAQNLNMIKRYVDSVPLVREFMGYVEALEGRAKLNFVLASAYDQVATNTLRNSYRQQSINYYQSAIDWGDQRNCVALYNIFDLNFKFLKAKPTSHDYIAKARLSLRRFIEEGRKPGSNFLRYKSSIQESARKRQQETDDPILLEDFSAILSW